ncbi:MAG: hypothetical protein KF729_05530 [Sandaracinaceae bacterium]|nr:hypothetical protein [Sandaracinaceae bacterium]
MESLAKPLRTLEDDLRWFVRATEVRLLHVTASADLRAAALKVVAGMEALPANRSPFTVLEDPFLRADHGWSWRARRMVEDWEGRVRVTAESGLELGSLSGQRPASADPLAAFGGWLDLVLSALRPPLEGLVVVLAPTRVEDGAAFESALLELLRRPELTRARFVAVEVGEAALPRLHEELGSAALRSRCERDDAAFADDLNALMRSVDPSLPGPARAGAAWPRGVIVPPRPGEREPTPEQQEEVDIELAAAGVSPSLAGAAGVRMQQYVIAAALHLREGNGPTAVDCQRQACHLAYEAGAKREALIQHLVLAGYELAAEMEADAVREYASVSERASLWDCPLEAAQAELALAVIAARHGRQPDAAAHYVRSAEAAQRADATGLAIEGWRLAGQMAAHAGLDQRAAECFGRAIELAEDAAPDVASSSSAPRAARQLAERLRAKGLGAQADSLEHTANRLEEGMPRSVAGLY